MSHFNRIRILDSWGDNVGATMTNQMMVAECHRLSGGVFNGTTPDTNYYTTQINANATATIAGSTLELKTTVDSGSGTMVYANSLARYMGANMNCARAIVRLGDTGKANNLRQFGICNGIGTLTFTDGFFFQLSGTTFSICARTNGTDLVINNGDFNGDVESVVVDAEYHTLEILYTNRLIEFYIDEVRIHIIEQTTNRICNTRHFYPFKINKNIGIGSVCSLFCDVITISRYGTNASQAKTFLQEGLTAGVLLKVGPGAIHLMSISGVVNNSVVTIYDGTSTAGKKLWASGAMSNQTVPFGISFDSNGGTPFINGLYLTVTATASNVFIKYE